MILSEVLGARALDADGVEVGRVIDARFRLESGETPSSARLVGFIVSPRGATSFLGYERRDVTRPVIVARLLRWMHRGSFLVRWEDVARIDGEVIRLRPGYRRASSELPR